VMTDRETWVRCTGTPTLRAASWSTPDASIQLP